MHFMFCNSCNRIVESPCNGEPTTLRVRTPSSQTCWADRWVWPPLVARVTSSTRISELFVTLGMSSTIPSMVHKRPSPHILSSISNRVPGVKSFTWPFHSLQQVGAATPFLASTLLASLAFLLGIAHGDDRDKCPRSEASSRGS
jgi:hypothetical protein